MKYLILISYWLLAVSLGCVYVPEQTNPGMDYEALYRDLLSPSVRITTDEGIGSGVIIHRGDAENAESIYILTAGHVVGNEALVSVELFGSSESLPAFVVATDTGKDLAILRITNHELRTTIYPAKLAPRDYVPYIFTPVWVIGCSLGYSPRPTAGEITAVSSEKGNGSSLYSLLATRYFAKGGVV